MRCTSCDYALWNLKTRLCPECGRAFRPGDYEFVRNSVKFCCPHCNQAYYGTGPKGHLVPAEFDCVRCSRRIGMDEMALLPAEGVDEKQTALDYMPWLERRRRGWWRAWGSTVWRALVAPSRLMRSVPESSPVKQAWWFAVATNALVMLVSVILTICVMGVVLPLLLAGARSTPGVTPRVSLLIAVMGGAMGFGMVGLFVVFLLFVVLWGLAAQLLLRITGPVSASIGRTYQALCYSSGAVVATLVPCVGNLAVIWWIVSAILMIKQAHKVHGVRATFAVLSFPVALLVLVAGLYAVLLTGAIFRARSLTAMPAAQARLETQMVLDDLIAHAGRGVGAGPPGHAVELLVSGTLTATDLVSASTLTELDDVPVADILLSDFMFLSAADQQKAARTAADALGVSTIAHRFGDFLFTYHGADLTAGDGRLWLVVGLPDPDRNPTPSPGDMIHIGLGDGSVTRTRYAVLASDLQAQNQYRLSIGLPPLPDLNSITHGAPATAE
ncbi:MAG: YIP1 family protein [Planctomycetes bacterium]|nr:YIP1 family protein [Planctomycetota bacterium]